MMVSPTICTAGTIVLDDAPWVLNRETIAGPTTVVGPARKLALLARTLMALGQQMDVHWGRVTTYFYMLGKTHGNWTVAG